MRAAAEIDEPAVAIERYLLTGLGELLDEVNLHEIAVFCVVLQAHLARLNFTEELFIARDYLGHLRFDRQEILVAEGFLAIDVVEESGVGCRPMTELRLGEQLENRRRHDVRGGVTDD